MAEILNKTITRKQANAIFACAKAGKIKLERWQMSSIYNLADISGDDCTIDWNGSINKEIEIVRDILACVFAGDYQKAQAKINGFYDLANYGKKFRNKADHRLIG